jgi:DNA (cytosine-5)-methyltransferase 1
MVSYATVCSGIECVSQAWKPLKWDPIFFSEHSVEHPWPAKFLAAKYPDTPNLGDMLTINGRDYEGKVNVLWGSTPCQSYSLAGRRKGITDSRGALTMKLIDLVDDINPDFVCWENVPGVLTDKTNAFGCLLGGLAGEIEPLVAPGGRWPDAGWVHGPRRRLAWRVFDAQYFGVAQCRRRVVLVGCPAEAEHDPSRVLFEWNETHRSPIQRHHRGFVPEPGAPGCFAAYGAAIRGRKHGQQVEIGDDLAYCLRASQGGSDKPMTLVWEDEWRLRNLTPVEAERLMGLPDNYTAIDGAADSVRYHAIGNGVAVPMVAWVGYRIDREMRRV